MKETNFIFEKFAMYKLFLTLPLALQLAQDFLKRKPEKSISKDSENERKKTTQAKQRENKTKSENEMKKSRKQCK